MNYETLHQSMTEMHQKIAEAQSFMQTHARSYIESGVQQFFEACPEVNAIFWRQYTPYFNDGEPCEFSVHDLFFNINGLEKYDGEGAYLYSEQDYNRAVERLENVKRFEADPAAWRQRYREEYKARSNRECTIKDVNLYPYPRTVESAQEAIDDILHQRSIISQARADEISTAYNALCSAFRLIPDDSMKAIYGDHVLVRITRSGTEIIEYSHD